MTGISTVPLPPGGSVEREFPLLESVPLARPGDYEITALIEHSAADRPAESPPLRLRFRPAAPRGLQLVSVSGGAAGLLYGATVNARSDPPEVVRYALAKSGHRGVIDARAVAPAPLAAEPMLSTPRNLTVEHSHFVAWLVDSALAFTHVDAEGRAERPGLVSLSGGDARIVALSITPYEAAAREPTGEALVVQGSRATGSRLDVIQLALTGARVGRERGDGRWPPDLAGRGRTIQGAEVGARHSGGGGRHRAARTCLARV